MNTNQTSGVKTLDKLVKILDCFSIERPAWSLAALSLELQTPKPSVHRMLTALGYHGLLRCGTEDELWRLGYRLYSWGNLVPEITGLGQVTRPVVRTLAAATGETAILTIYDNQEVVCVDKVESGHTVRMTLFVGTRRQPHAGASSKILMAYLPDEEIKAIIKEKGLPKLSTNTITDPQELQNELNRIRKLGYAISHEETDLGAWGVAVPVLDGQGEVTAAIGVAGPYSRHSKAVVRRYVELCRQAAKKITALLSGKSWSESPEHYEE